MNWLLWLCAAWLLAGCVSAPVLDAGQAQGDDARAPSESAGALARSNDAGLAAAGGCGAQCNSPARAMAAGAASVPALHDADADTGAADDGDDAGTVATHDSGVGPNGRPVGVAECYSTASSGHAATQRHWEVLHSGDFAARGDMISQLSMAAEAQPNEEQFALLLGLASLWRVAEPYSPESLDPLLTLDSIQTAQRELERAYALCPTDHRIPAWLGPIKIRMGRMLEDSALVDEGFAVLKQGIMHYPGFVLFSKLLVYADLPASDPDFLQAVDAVRENTMYCGTVVSGLASDPACHNHPHASHNIEGSSVFLGDMYAKAQDRAAALAAYKSAKSVPTWDSWDYQSLLEERITTLDARMAAAVSASTTDDLPSAWTSEIQCSLCHRE